MPLEIRDELVDQMVKRKMAQEEYAPKPKEQPDMPSGAFDPTLMSILGSVADGASTFNFLKDGGQEGNALYNGLGGNPLTTGLAVAGTGLAEMGLTKLIGKKFPKLADILLANQGAERTAVAANNFSDINDSSLNAFRRSTVNALTGRKR